MNARRVIGGFAAAAAVSMASMTGMTPRAGARPLDGPLSDITFAGPPTTATCRALARLACYSPDQLQTAYDMKALYAGGLSGTGATIAIVDPYGSPTIARDLAVFDRAFGLPAPRSLRVIRPAGAIPRYRAADTHMVSWAIETSLDVESAHAIAPGANILLVETPTDETIGPAGFPDIVRVENYVIDHQLGDVISQSFGAGEKTFSKAGSLLALRGAYQNALAHNVTVLAASGDQGRTTVSDFTGSALFTTSAANWPASDPLVTSIGGTQLHLDARGNRVAPDNVFNDTAILGGPAAGGGGVSGIFSRPSYQDGVRSVVGAQRGYPDIAMSSAQDGGALVYTSFGGARRGYHIVGGTSVGTPMFAGVTAVADQAAGTRVGLLNPRLYRAGSGSPGIPDITLGDNSVRFTQNGRRHRVRGNAAAPGYDLASGLGTIDGARFVAQFTAPK